MATGGGNQEEQLRGAREEHQKMKIESTLIPPITSRLGPRPLSGQQMAPSSAP
jgi:hypothetical protein